MNGEALPFDHGYPLRVVVPGWSSKCSLKWINKISVQDKETEARMYHRYYKWFPKHITNPDKQLDEVMATPPVTELNTNAVPFQPRDGTSAKKGPVKVTGYCFTGGGRPVHSVQVSIDGERTWQKAKVVREEKTSQGRCYAWVLWELILSDFDPEKCVADGLSADKEMVNGIADRGTGELVVRAFDISAQGMTPKPEWNLTGMMNNCYFRMKLKKSVTGWVWQHPTTWMDPEKRDKVVVEAAWKWDRSSGGGKKADKENLDKLNGVWSVGEGLQPLSLNVTNASGSGYGLLSAEKMYGGEQFKAVFAGAVADGVVDGTFGPYFTVRGEIGDGKIVWNNGAVWWKM